MRSPSSRRIPNTLGSYSPEYAASRQTTVKPGYVAVRGISRKPVTHVVKAGGMGAIAKAFLHVHALPTLCAMTVTNQWTMLGNGTTVTCNSCRHAMLNDPA